MKRFSSRRSFYWAIGLTLLTLSLCTLGWGLFELLAEWGVIVPKWTFKRYPKFAEAIVHADQVVLFEGLPHQFFESSRLKQELNTKKTLQVHDHDFYLEPLKLKPGDAEELTRLFANTDSFGPYGGPKGCGGFHPDYCIEWHVGQHIYRCLVCFGCQEIKVYGPNGKIHCEFKDEPVRYLAVLKPYRKNRPEHK